MFSPVYVAVLQPNLNLVLLTEQAAVWPSHVYWSLYERTKILHFVTISEQQRHLSSTSVVSLWPIRELSDLQTCDFLLRAVSSERTFPLFHFQLTSVSVCVCQQINGPWAESIRKTRVLIIAERRGGGRRETDERKWGGEDGRARTIQTDEEREREQYTLMSSHTFLCKHKSTRSRFCCWWAFVSGFLSALLWTLT